MLRRAILTLALASGAALPVMAGNASVMAVTATQQTDTCVYFSSLVYATSTVPIAAIEFVVTQPGGSTSVVTPQSIERNDMDGAGVYVVYRVSASAHIVSGGDVLTVTVRDADGSEGSRSVPCTSGRKRSSGVSCG